MKLLRNEVSCGHEVKFARHVRSTLHSGSYFIHR